MVSFAKALANVSVKVDKVATVVDAFRELAARNVLVGVPQAKSSRPNDSEITNAELAYIHTHGSPVNNIPPRPFLQPSIEKNIIGVATLQKQIVGAALEGKPAQVDILQNRLGLYAQKNAKEYITMGDNLAPNAPATIARKGSDRPLIHTGQLLNSITYVITDD